MANDMQEGGVSKKRDIGTVAKQEVQVTAAAPAAPSDEVDQALAEALVQLAEETARLAVPPVSDFRVGAVALGASGRLYAGVNVELPGQPLQQTIHAEHFCMASAFANGDETAFRAVGVTAAPCGHCRQMLAETPAAANLKVCLRDPAGKVHVLSLLDDLLPWAITADLLPDAAQDKSACGLTVQPVPEASGGARAAEAAQAAFERSRTPYSRSPAACVLVAKPASPSEAPAVFAGSCLESVAFNPGVPPMQSAIIEFMVQRLGTRLGAVTATEAAAKLRAAPSIKLWEELRSTVASVVLVQRAPAGRLVDHEPTVRAILSSLCPDAQLVSQLAL